MESVLLGLFSLSAGFAAHSLLGLLIAFVRGDQCLAFKMIGSTLAAALAANVTVLAYFQTII